MTRLAAVARPSRSRRQVFRWPHLLATLAAAGLGIVAFVGRGAKAPPTAASPPAGEAERDVISEVAVTAVRSQTCVPLAGNSDVSRSGMELLPPFLRMVDIEPSFDLHVDTVSYFCERASTIKSAVAVYYSNSGNKLGDSGPAKVRSCQAGEWVDVPLMPPISLQAGKSYYIAHLHALGIWSTARGTCNQFCKQRGNHFSARWDHGSLPLKQPTKMEMLGDGKGQSLPLTVKYCSSLEGSSLEAFAGQHQLVAEGKALQLDERQIKQLTTQVEVLSQEKTKQHELIEHLRNQISQDSYDRRKQFQLQTEQGKDQGTLLHDRTHLLQEARARIVDLETRLDKANHTALAELTTLRGRLQANNATTSDMSENLQQLQTEHKQCLSDHAAAKASLEQLQHSAGHDHNYTAHMEEELHDENMTVAKWKKAMVVAKRKAVELELALRDLNHTNKVFAKDSLNLYRQVVYDKGIIQKQTNTIVEAKSNISHLTAIVGQLYTQLKKDNQTMQQNGHESGTDVVDEGSSSSRERYFKAQLQQAKEETDALKQKTNNLTTVVAELNQQLVTARLKMTDDMQRSEGALVQAAAASRNYAFVMMAHAPEGEKDEHIWGVLAVAMAIRRLSVYPLVLLTNATTFPDGTNLQAGLSKLNVKVMPVYAESERWPYEYWKLQIWKLTQFKKLIWLDSDVILYRSIDWLFDRPWMWAQRDDWMCGQADYHTMCSGVMLMEPNEADYSGMKEYAQSQSNLQDGDQHLIAQYFANVVHRPVHLLSETEASFGQCVGRAASFYRNGDGSSVAGIWDMPAVIHKSGGWGSTGNTALASAEANACFTPNMTLQLYQVADTVVNICQYNPLGAYWRHMFCKAAALVDIRIREISAFCDDACWYRGKGDRYFDQSEGVQCSQNATLYEADYENRILGHPIRSTRETSTLLPVLKQYHREHPIS